MGDFVPFGSGLYFLFAGVLLIARGMDFLSTWVATPHMVLEGNPIAKLLGWRWGAIINLALCVVFGLWPLPAIVISTTSLLVAARNFQSAWLMRSMGEAQYRDWYIQRIQETRITLYLLCLAGNTGLTAAVGAAIVYFAGDLLVLLGLGLGVVAYAGTVAFYTLLAVWRMRRASLREEKRRAKFLSPRGPGLVKLCAPEDPQPLQ